MSKEVHGTPEGTWGYENQERRSGSHAEAEDDGDDEAEHPGEVSIKQEVLDFPHYLMAF